MTSHDVLGEIPAQLWRMLVVAHERQLMLDYDGTLAPFTMDRHAARPLPRVIALLRRIAATPRTGVAIVSGRPVRELEELAGPTAALLVGEHGWEWRYPNGVLVQQALDPVAASAIEAATRAAREKGWSRFVERKRAAVVLHTRSLAADAARELEDRCVERWEHLAVAALLTLDRIDGGVELRARRRNKGTVVQSIRWRSTRGALGVFVGDDATDEDAFDAVREWGVGIRVGMGNQASAALGRLRSTDAVPAFLEEWLRLTEPSQPGAA